MIKKNYKVYFKKEFLGDFDNIEDLEDRIRDIFLQGAYPENIIIKSYVNDEYANSMTLNLAYIQSIFKEKLI